MQYYKNITCNKYLDAYFMLKSTRFDVINFIMFPFIADFKSLIRASGFTIYL